MEIKKEKRGEGEMSEKSKKREIRRKKSKRKLKCMCEVANLFFPNSIIVLMTKKEKELYDEWKQSRLIYNPVEEKGTKGIIGI